MVEDQVVPGAKNAGNVLVGIGIEGQAEGVDTLPGQFLDGLLGIEAQVLRVAHIVVGRFAVGQQQNQFLVARASGKMFAGVAQGGAHAG